MKHNALVGGGTETKPNLIRTARVTESREAELNIVEVSEMRRNINENWN